MQGIEADAAFNHIRAQNAAKTPALTITRACPTQILWSLPDQQRRNPNRLRDWGFGLKPGNQPLARTLGAFAPAKAKLLAFALRGSPSGHCQTNKDETPTACAIGVSD